MDNEQQAQNPYGSWPPPAPTVPMLPGGKRERIFAPILLILSLIIGNTGPYAGLGFAIPFVLMGAVTIWYVWKKETFSAYGLACILLSMVLAAANGRTSDPLVLILFAPLTLGAYFLGLVAMTGANARPLGRFSSLLDMFYAAFNRTFTQVFPALRGLFRRREQGKKVSPAFWGVLIAIPVLFLVVPLLSSADAAFEGLLSGFTKHIPKNSELITGLFWGLIVFVLAYAQAVSLRANGPRPARKVPGGEHPRRRGQRLPGSHFGGVSSLSSEPDRLLFQRFPRHFAKRFHGSGLCPPGLLRNGRPRGPESRHGGHFQRSGAEKWESTPVHPAFQPVSADFLPGAHRHVLLQDDPVCGVLRPDPAAGDDQPVHALAGAVGTFCGGDAVPSPVPPHEGGRAGCPCPGLAPPAGRT